MNILTQAQLDELPMDSVVVDSGRVAWQLIEHGDHGPLHWHNAFAGMSHMDGVRLPAKLVWPVDLEVARKAQAFDDILLGYNDEGVDDMDSDWMQGSFYDNVVTRYLGIPTWFNGLEENA